MTQNSLLAHYYTALHEYGDEERFPDPPPSASDIIATWDANFKPVKQHVESGLACVASGKTVHKPMRLEDKTPAVTRNGSSMAYLRRPSGNALKAPPSPSINASS